MARVLVENHWFEQVEPSTFSEVAFEDRVVLHAPSVYPEYFVVAFKYKLNTNLGGVTPDLVFISRSYEEWKIVEVEMGYHYLNSHVEPQVEKLANADYDERIVDYLCNKNEHLDRERTFKLVTDSPPQILVIVNEPKPDWDKQLARYGASVVTFELFRSEDNLEVFRVDGEYPSFIRSSLSTCTFHPFVPRLLEVLQPHSLDLPHGRIIRLRYNNCITEWTRIDAEGRVWLQPVGRNPLVSQHRYEIYKQNDSTLVLRKGRF